MVKKQKTPKKIWRPPGNLTNISTRQFLTSAAELVEKVRRRANLTTDVSLQEDAIRNLHAFAHISTKHKKRAVDRASENDANLLLCVECVLDALRAELRMWVLLKEKQYDHAWNYLISAQRISDAARRAHEIHKKFDIETYETKLSSIEKIIFPEQMFNSPGMIAKTRDCTICGKNYDNCTHIAGKAYWGEFCQVKPKDLTFDHLALVEEPADKMARGHSIGKVQLDDDGNEIPSDSDEQIDIMAKLPLKEIPDSRIANEIHDSTSDT